MNFWFFHSISIYFKEDTKIECRKAILSTKNTLWFIGPAVQWETLQLWLLRPKACDKCRRGRMLKQIDPFWLFVGYLTLGLLGFKNYLFSSIIQIYSRVTVFTSFGTLILPDESSLSTQADLRALESFSSIFLSKQYTHNLLIIFLLAALPRKIDHWQLQPASISWRYVTSSYLLSPLPSRLSSATFTQVHVSSAPSHWDSSSSRPSNCPAAVRVALFSWSTSWAPAVDCSSSGSNWHGYRGYYAPIRGISGCHRWLACIRCTIFWVFLSPETPNSMHFEVSTEYFIHTPTISPRI